MVAIVGITAGVHLGRCMRLTARPYTRIKSATVFSFTRQPASHRSAVIRGDPSLPSCSVNNCATSAASRSRRSAWGGSHPLAHL
jgi:hypothetical protein